MRRWIGFFSLMFLAGCAPPHPTHPTKIDCGFQRETTFAARIDNSPIGTVQQGEDPCNSGGGLVSFESWTQTDWSSAPICVAAGTTREQASAYCVRYLHGIGIRVGEPATSAVIPDEPSGRRVCPGSEHVISARYTAIGGASGSHPDACPEGTTWPLQP